MEPEVEVEAKEANSSRTKILVAEATRMKSRTNLSVTTVTRRATLQRTAPTKRAMMMIRNQVDQGRLHQPRRPRKKKKKKKSTSNSSNSNNRAKNPGSILCQ